MKPILLLLGLLVTLSGFSQSVDSVLIRGQVISKDKCPLPSVTVRVSHTDKVVFSDTFGQFELWSPIEGILEFSCISEPYKISLSSIDAGKKNELLKFEFDLKQQNTNLKAKKLKGRTIKVNNVNPGRISDIILAYYNSDFERITKKNYDNYLSQNYKIIFMVGGQVMPDSFTLNDLDYSSLNNVAILRIIDSYDKIIFMMSTKLSR
jgi:hypothetical protein